MKILFASNASYGGYGYSIVAKNVMKGLRNLGHEVSNLSMQTIGDSIKDEEGNMNFPHRYDAFLSDSITDMIQSYSADILVSLLDAWIPNYNSLVNGCIALKIPWLFHVTVHSNNLFPLLNDRCSQATSLVAPSRYGYTVLLNHGYRNANYIPHGFNPSLYYPMDKKDIKEEKGYKDKFLFLSVQRNRWDQKNLHGMLIAYRDFLLSTREAAEKTKLLLLTDVHEPDNGMNIVNLRNIMGLNNNVEFLKVKLKDDTMEFTGENDGEAINYNNNFRLREKEMCRLYNMADCLVTSSFGESFNLPCLESQACGVPQIFVNHTTSTELVKDRKSGLLVDIMPEPQYNQNLREFYIMSRFSMASCMKKMFFDSEFREQCSRNAKLNLDQYKWENIIPLWNKLIQGVYENYYFTPNFSAGILGV